MNQSNRRKPFAIVLVNVPQRSFPPERSSKYQPSPAPEPCPVVSRRLEKRITPLKAQSLEPGRPLVSCASPLVLSRKQLEPHEVTEFTVPPPEKLKLMMAADAEVEARPITASTAARPANFFVLF